MDKKNKQNDQTEKTYDPATYPNEINRNNNVNNKTNKDTSERVSFADRGDANSKAFIQNPSRMDKKLNENVKSNRVNIRLVDSHEKESKIKDKEGEQNVGVSKKVDGQESKILDHGDTSTLHSRSAKNMKRLYENIKINDISHERAVEKIGLRKKDTVKIEVVNTEAPKPNRRKPINVEENAQNRVTNENGDESNKPAINKVKNERKPDAVTKIIESTEKAEVKKDLVNFDNSKYDLRKRIRDKYTVKLKSQEESRTRDVTSGKADNRAKRAENSQKPSNAEPIKPQQLEKEIEELKRRPVIKTVTSKNGPAVYKAVTFVRKGPSKVLQIHIPTDKKTSKGTETVPVKIKTKLSRVSLKEVKQKSRNRHVFYKKPRKYFKTKREFSPERCISTESPITEVAKWAPSCVNRHTKPYYEAWVNTTLAAISRSSKKNKLLLENKSILESFQRALEEGPPSPELVYGDFADEKYTGKIRVVSNRNRLSQKQ